MTPTKCYTFSYTFVTLFVSSISVTLLRPKYMFFPSDATEKKLRRDGKISPSRRRFEDPYKGAGVSHGNFYKRAD